MSDTAGQPDEKQRLAKRYRIDGSIGRGGMSEVFHGYDERLDRRVAIKLLRSPASVVIPATPDSPEAAEILDSLERDRLRFLREIRITGQLEHPGIPAVYDTGDEGPDGGKQLWLVMQLLRGSTLESLLNHANYDTTPPTIAWAASIAGQIAAVLTDVHRVDIVHRDLKPANVMLVDGGLVKVLDFGIAILRGAGALPRLTQIDRTVGTPPYMSPEQCLGQAVTTASDIYSLGCLLFELLTGDVPYHGTTAMPLCAHHLQSPVPSVRARRPEISPELDDLVSSMLDKQAVARPSAEAVYEALLPLATGSEQPTGGDENRDPTRPFRRPLLAPAKRREPTTSRGRITEQQAEELKANVKALLDNDRPSEAISLLEDGVARAAHDSFIELQLRHSLAAALFYAGEYTRSGSLFEVVGRDYAKHLPPTNSYVLHCAYHAGHAYAEIGNSEKALPQLRFFVQNATGTSDEAPEQIRESRFVIAQMLASAGRSDESLAELEAVRVLLVEELGVGSTQVKNLDKQIARMRALLDRG
ncbi:protein kinase [Nonomuraea sp. NPDC050663]|uniref:serine/threonine-protein kinase n=1 Tax=Nonomuraea sp. NPDC050663 TaxID=3364370 RepID=UPI0037B22A90